MAPALWGADLLVYVGTYNSPKSKGIYAWRLDTATGKLDSLGLMAETTSPSFLAVHPSRRFLYAVSEIATHEGKKSQVWKKHQPPPWPRTIVTSRPVVKCPCSRN